MATRAQQAQLLRNPAFQDQVEGALIHAASQILQEAQSTANHENRLRWANAIVANSRGQMQFFLTGTLTNASVAASAGDPASISDNDIDYVVASLFDAYANQYKEQRNIGATLQMGEW